MENDKPIYIREAALFFNRSIKCLQAWDRSNKLVAHRTSTNRRFYYKNELINFLQNADI